MLLSDLQALLRSWDLKTPQLITTQDERISCKKSSNAAHYPHITWKNTLKPPHHYSQFNFHTLMLITLK